MNILLKSLTITLSLIAGLPAMEDENNKPKNCAPVVEYKFLTVVVKDNYVEYDFTNFLESVRPLREVCSQWNDIIDNDFMHKAMVLGCQQICPGFLESSLIFRPIQGSDEGMVVFKISDLWNPLGGAFPLSQCKYLDEKGIENGNAGQFLSISTGYRKGMKAENINKLEIWFPPRFLVEKELGTTAGHLKLTFTYQWSERVAVGMLCTSGGDFMDWYDYLLDEGVNFSKRNLFELYLRLSQGGSSWERSMAGLPLGYSNDRRRLLSSFVCELK